MGHCGVSRLLPCGDACTMHCDPSAIYAVIYCVRCSSAWPQYRAPLTREDSPKMNGRWHVEWNRRALQQSDGQQTDNHTRFTSTPAGLGLSTPRSWGGEALPRETPATAAPATPPRAPSSGGSQVTVSPHTHTTTLHVLMIVVLYDWCYMLLVTSM